MQSCCFVNTDKPTVRIHKHNLFRYNKGEDSVSFEQLATLVYKKHTDPKEHAEVSILEWIPVTFPKWNEEMAMRVIDTMSELQNFVSFVS